MRVYVYVQCKGMIGFWCESAQSPRTGRNENDRVGFDVDGAAPAVSPTPRALSSRPNSKKVYIRFPLSPNAYAISSPPRRARTLCFFLSTSCCFRLAPVQSMPCAYSLTVRRAGGGGAFAASSASCARISTWIAQDQ
jgi:hypothetical protein